MGERTAISWTDHTFNPWIGCSKVLGAQECLACYAERDMDHRLRRVQWGDEGSRLRTSVDYWDQPRKWNDRAQAEGTPRRVFCASLADVFEEPPPSVTRAGRSRSDDQFLEWRRDLFEVIDATPALEWQLLTKRPWNILGRWPRLPSCNNPKCKDPECRYRANVWLGTSAGTIASARHFVPQLLRCRDLAPVLFVSAEPLLDAVDLAAILHDDLVWIDALQGRHGVYHPLRGQGPAIDWVIVGVESAGRKRLGRLGAFKTEAAWWDHARRLVEQCAKAGVACFVKQGPRSGFVVTDPADFPPGEWPREFPSKEGSRC